MRINYIAAMGSIGLPLNAAPQFDGLFTGSFASGAAAITPGVPTGLVANDILLCFVQSSNEVISAPTNSGAGTWAEVTNSPNGVGTAATAGSVRLGVFWMRYTGASLGTVTVADTGNHTIAWIEDYRGCVTSGNPWNVTSGQTQTGTTTTATFPSLTTTVGNCLIVFVVANAVDTATVQFNSIVSQGNLTSAINTADSIPVVPVSTIVEGNTTSGTGGGLGVGCGKLDAAGSAGTVQFTMVSSSANYAEMMIALTSN